MRKLFLMFCIAINIFAYDLSVSIDNLDTQKGVVLFSLYNKDGSIPDKELNKYFFQQKAFIKNNSSKTVFKNLKKGRYAITILHDENSNNKIDKGFILPIEGFGVSNYKAINIFTR